jgi:hypothetical protein
MTEEQEVLNENIDYVLDLMIDQMILTENGGKNHIDLDDLENFDMDEYANVTGEMEFELASILRKKYLMKHPDLNKVAREIAVKLVSKGENNEHQSV